MKRVALLLIVACGTSAGPVHTSQYLASAITLPAARVDFATDVNGDGTTDNAFGVLLGALGQQGIDPQAPEDAAVSTGKAAYLIKVDSHDTALVSDASAEATLLAGTPGPAFPGPYTVDASIPAAALTGALAAGVFSSTPQATTGAPVDLSLRLAVFGTVVPLPLHGAFVSFHAVATGLTAGRINGVLKAADVLSVLVPAMASGMTAIIAANPTSTESQHIKSLFDTGGCAGATANDGRIDACEVSQNTLIKTLLSPDIEAFDAGGNWKPSSANANRNGFSLGVGFTAGPTTF